MVNTPKKARFNRITESDGYKFVPANKTAEKFCKEYGTYKIRTSEVMNLKIGYDQINWK